MWSNPGVILLATATVFVLILVVFEMAKRFEAIAELLVELRPRRRTPFCKAVLWLMQNDPQGWDALTSDDQLYHRSTKLRLSRRTDGRWASSYGPDLTHWDARAIDRQANRLAASRLQLRHTEAVLKEDMLT